MEDEDDKESFFNFKPLEGDMSLNISDTDSPRKLPFQAYLPDLKENQKVDEHKVEESIYYQQQNSNSSNNACELIDDEKFSGDSVQMEFNSQPSPCSQPIDEDNYSEQYSSALKTGLIEVVSPFKMNEGRSGDMRHQLLTQRTFNVVEGGMLFIFV